jgi:cyclopropane-fatty-acyl-phospholipid synthase
MQFGEGYMHGRVTVRGSLDEIVEALSRLPVAAAGWRDMVAQRLERANTVTGSRDNVHHHYDLGNDFYRQWLDAEMLYTCAYFPTPEATLEQAQIAKMDLVCRKLRLKAGERVVEAGCGWGALALHMARRYGVFVKAFNLSKEQLAWARKRASDEGLSDRVEFVDDDYRSASGQFDAFVSIGMLEHVGRANFAALGEVLRRVIGPNGRGMLHFIGRDAPRPLNAWIRRRIFPGAYPPTLAEVTDHILSPAGMSVQDVENLRLHYARTLECWSERFAAARSSVLSMYGEPFTRAWELYLAGSRAAFITGWMQLFQVVFSPRSAKQISWTRRDSFSDDVPA